MKKLFSIVMLFFREEPPEETIRAVFPLKKLIEQLDMNKEHSLKDGEV